MSTTAYQKNASDYRHPEVQPRLSEEQKRWLLAYLLRDADIFMNGSLHLKLEYFDIAVEPDLRLVWLTATTLAKRYGEAILFADVAKAWNLVDAEAKAYSQHHPDEILPERWEMLFAQPQGLLAWIYSLKPEEMHAEYGRELLTYFLRERRVQEPLRRMVAEADGRVIANFKDVLCDLQNRESEIETIQTRIAEWGAPDGWEPEPLKHYPTGLAFIDAMIGGQAPGETYGVLGAFGSGKTTLAVQLVYQTALLEQKAVDGIKGENGAEDILPTKPLKDMRYSFLFHYEASSQEIRCRLWSHAAKIPYEKLLLWDKTKLSRMGHLADYELTRYADLIKAKGGPQYVEGERERLEAARVCLRRNVLTCDMSGPADRPAQGSGYIPEIAAEIARNVRLGYKPAIVVIDYAGICCDRYLTAKNLRDDQLRHLLKRFADHCRRQIAEPFQTPVWIMHQLSGEANERTHATKQHHAWAAECKSFAENLVFAFNMGTKDEMHGAFYFTNTKARRTQEGKPILLIMDKVDKLGALNTLIEADHLIVDYRGQVVTKVEQAQTHSGTHAWASWDPEDFSPGPFAHSTSHSIDPLTGFMD